MKERNIFEGMVFQSPSVSKEEYIDMYPEYVRRCSEAYKRLELSKRRLDYEVKQERRRLSIISIVIGTMAIILSVTSILLTTLQ